MPTKRFAPTSVQRTPASMKQYLTQPQYRLYKLIWERFVASQMADAQVENTAYDIQAGSACSVPTALLLHSPAI